MKNQDDNTLEHLRLALRVRKAAGNLKEFVKALNGYITSTLIEMFIEQLIEKYTTEEQRKAFIREVCKILLDSSYPGKIVAEKFSQILNKEPVTEEYSNTSLHLAAEQGNLNAVKYFVEKGGDISAQDEMGYTPLHLAAKQGNLDIIKYLVEKGADVDVYQGGWGYSTPLHLAAANGHLDTVKYLMGKGANPNAIDGDGKTPLQRANEKGHLNIVEYFASRGLQVTEVPQTTERQQVTTEAPRTTEGQQITGGQQVTTEVPHTTERRQVTTETPQTTEASQITTEVLKTTEDYSHTTLHRAAEQGNLNAVKYFVEKGKDKKGEIPLDEGSGSGHVDIVGYSKEEGQQVTERSRVTCEPDNTSLHSAAKHGELG